MSSPETFLDGKVKLLRGDCLELLPTLEAESIDSCVTDPPYHLTSIVKRFGNVNSAPINNRDEREGRQGPYHRSSKGFMGKQWDGGDIAFRPELWAEVLRVLKPGAHLLAFGGDRTYHRLAAAIEDAGFEIRGTLAYVFGSGFPKSLNVSAKLACSLPADAQCVCAPDGQQTILGSQSDCQNDHGCGDEQPPSEGAGDPDALPSQGDVLKHSPSRQHGGDLGAIASHNHLSPSAHLSNGGSSPPTSHQSEDFPYADNIQFGTPLNKSRGGSKAGRRTGNRKSDTQHLGDDSASFSLEDVNLPQCQKCGGFQIPQGVGTALKPAMELICFARKPLSESSIAANVLKHGTGGINIDSCRIGTDGGTKRSEQAEYPKHENGKENRSGHWARVGHKVVELNKGRWPANLIHDGSEEVVERFPESGNGSGEATVAKRQRNKGWCNSSPGDGVSAIDNFGDSGSAARFFYTAKADKLDRITRTVEEVTVEWISEQGPQQVRLQVDTEQSPERAIVVSGSDTRREWSTFLSGSIITALFRKASKCTTETGTNSTTESKTWSLLTRSLTNASIAVANCATVNGGSHAANVEAGSQSVTITLAKTASLPGADHAIPGTQLKISVSAARSHGHPTCKPLDLMQYLVRLITPRGGTCLDPFAGTGTTGEACFREAMEAVLIEREPEYQADIVKRMGLCLAGPDERRAASVKQEGLEDTPLFGDVL